MRITTNMMLNSMVTQLNQSSRRVQRVQEQVAYGRRIVRPSDDPAGCERALRLRSTLRAYASYMRSVDQGAAQLVVTEAALETATGALEEAVVLAMRLRSDTFSDGERQAAATQARELLATVLSAANTKHQDHYLFAGFQTDTQPFTLEETPAPSATYHGDQGVQRLAVGPGQTVAVSLPGDGVFQPALDALIGLVGALEDPDGDLGASVAALNGAVDAILQATTAVGQRAAMLRTVGENLASLEITVKADASEVEELDYAEAALRLANEDAAYQALLAMAAKLPQPLLIEMIR